MNGILNGNPILEARKIARLHTGKGADGKSAYRYAREGGYTGTEAEFTALLGKIESSREIDETLLATMQAENQAFIVEELAKRDQTKLLFVSSTEEMTDTNQLYVCDGWLWGYTVAEIPVEPVNVLDEVGQVVGRLSSSGNFDANATYIRTTGFIPCDDDDVLTIVGWHGYSGNQNYIIAYDAAQNVVAIKYMTGGGESLLYIPTAGNAMTITSFDAVTNTIVTAPLAQAMGGVTGIAYVRISAGELVGDDYAIYVNKDSQTGTSTVADWYALEAFVPTDRDADIDTLMADRDDHEVRIAKLERTGGDAPETVQEAIERIRCWDAPIHDAAPAVLIDGEKEAITGKCSVDAVNAAYEALRARYPRYITRTLLGNASDGVTPIYRYDFCAPKPHENNGGINPSIERPKVILVSGIHYEWVGIWSLYYAMEEIMSNPDFGDIRRNAHLIVLPLTNPYCLLAGNYEKTNGRKNANGVEIHRNFAVEHAVVDPASNYYGGEAPLSEVETRYIDGVLRENTDAALFVSCHNFNPGGGTAYGTSFIWPSSATNYLYNLGGRFLVKMSEAWEDKYGQSFRDNIDACKTALQPEGDYTVGIVGRSTTPGTEAKQCMLYGVQGTTLEVGGDMVALGSSAGDSVTVSRGAEVYANFIKTALACFDPKDKHLYAPVLACGLQE